jgi:hypothetical protein
VHPAEEPELKLPPSSLVSSLGFRRAKLGGDPGASVMGDDDYIAFGKQSNNSELSAAEAEPVFRLLDDDDDFDGLLEVPFGLKQVKDLRVVMRHSVAVAGDRREDLTRNPLFCPAFAAFTLGFSIGLAQAHRLRHLGVRANLARMSRKQAEMCAAWGVEIATYFLATVDEDGVFGKTSDFDLYGIPHRWRLVADDRRLETFGLLKECVERGRRAAHAWFEDETVDVPPHFLDALANFVDAYPNQNFE